MGDLFSYALDSDLTKLRFLRESERIQVLSRDKDKAVGKTLDKRARSPISPWLVLSAPQ